MSRINLLKEKDIEMFDNPIELSHEERKILFTLEFDGEFDPNLRKGITTVGYILLYVFKLIWTPSCRN